MTSNEHQKLVNALALGMEQYKGIKITAIDMAGDPTPFDQKYQHLRKPDLYGNRRPDLVGEDVRGIHLGEAETDMGAENLDEQLRTFANHVADNTNTSIALHVIVPQSIREDMEGRICALRLGHMLNDRIIVWHSKD